MQRSKIKAGDVYAAFRNGRISGAVRPVLVVATGTLYSEMSRDEQGKNAGRAQPHPIFVPTAATTPYSAEWSSECNVGLAVLEPGLATFGPEAERQDAENAERLAAIENPRELFEQATADKIGEPYDVRAKVVSPRSIWMPWSEYLAALERQRAQRAEANRRAEEAQAEEERERSVRRALTHVITLHSQLGGGAVDALVDSKLTTTQLGMIAEALSSLQPEVILAKAAETIRQQEERLRAAKSAGELVVDERTRRRLGGLSEAASLIDPKYGGVDRVTDTQVPRG